MTKVGVIIRSCGCGFMADYSVRHLGDTVGVRDQLLISFFPLDFMMYIHACMHACIHFAYI